MGGEATVFRHHTAEQLGGEEVGGEVMGKGSIIIFSEEEKEKGGEDAQKNKDQWTLLIPDYVCRSHSTRSCCPKKCIKNKIKAKVLSQRQYKCFLTSFIHTYL